MDKAEATFPAIDAVITWVDGNDPKLRLRKACYLQHGEDKFDDVAGATRYTSVGEIYLCIASINRYAPFIRRIFIVTDQQDPCLDDYLNEHFPNGYIPYEIVDHSVIFRGYEQYLPCYNSRAIETMLWRIPGLSEQYVYFNDDVMLIAPVTPEDFFRAELTCCYARPYSTALAHFLSWLKPRRNGHKPMGFKTSLMGAMRYTGRKRRFLFLLHTPMALRRHCYEQFYAEHPDALIANISHRFRHPSQYNPQELFYLQEREAGRCLILSSHSNTFYFKPHTNENYQKRKLQELFNTTALFCCVNSLDQSSPSDRDRFMQSLADKIL